MSTPIEQQSIGPRIVHLVSGEDVIGDVIPVVGGYKIADPISVALTPAPDGRGVRISIVPLRPYAKEIDSMVISDDHVIFMAELSEQMLSSYKAYTSNIVIPEAPALSSLLS